MCKDTISDFNPHNVTASSRLEKDGEEGILPKTVTFVLEEIRNISKKGEDPSPLVKRISTSQDASESREDLNPTT